MNARVETMLRWLVERAPDVTREEAWEQWAPPEWLESSRRFFASDDSPHNATAVPPTWSMLLEALADPSRIEAAEALHHLALTRWREMLVETSRLVAPSQGIHRPEAIPVTPTQEPLRLWRTGAGDSGSSINGLSYALSRVPGAESRPSPEHDVLRAELNTLIEMSLPKGLSSSALDLLCSWREQRVTSEFAAHVIFDQFKGYSSNFAYRTFGREFHLLGLGAPFLSPFEPLARLAALGFDTELFEMHPHPALLLDPDPNLEILLEDKLRLW